MSKFVGRKDGRSWKEPTYEPSDYKSKSEVKVEAEVKPACETNTCSNCTHLGKEGDCENPNEEIEGIIDLGSLDINKFGCTYFSKSV